MLSELNFKPHPKKDSNLQKCFEEYNSSFINQHPNITSCLYTVLLATFRLVSSFTTSIQQASFSTSISEYLETFWAFHSVSAYFQHVKAIQNPFSKPHSVSIISSLFHSISEHFRAVHSIEPLGPEEDLLNGTPDFELVTCYLLNDLWIGLYIISEHFKTARWSETYQSNSEVIQHVPCSQTHPANRIQDMSNNFQAF